MDERQIQEQYRARTDYEDQLIEKWEKVSSRTLPHAGIAKGKSVNFLAGITNTTRARLLACLYENAQRWLNNLEEDTRAVSVGSFQKYVFPVIRAAYANSPIIDLVSIQPMDSPHGAVYYFDTIFGDTKGNVTAGDRMHDATSGPSDKFHYADATVENEAVGTGDGATSAFTGTCDWKPIIPGTVSITDGDQEVQDDGNGNLEGDAYAGGVIDYYTGIYSLTFSDAPDLADSVVVSYRYDNEGVNPPSIELQLTGSPVTAEAMKLMFKWSIEAQQDLKAQFGMDAEAELVNFAGNEIQKEIAYKIISKIYANAGAGAVTWEQTPEDGVQYYFHKHSFIDTLNEASGLISKANQRGRGNWIIGGVDVINVLRSVDPKMDVNEDVDGVGINKVGRIASLDVYQATFMDDKKFLIGRKGKTLIDAGFIYAPYLGVYTTGTVVLEDQLARRSMAVRAADKMINSGDYCTGTITQT